MDTAEALSFLTQARGEEVSPEQRAGLGIFASSVLRSKGELLFTHFGTWNPAEFGQQCSTTQGTLVTQATWPIRVEGFGEDQYIALRNQATHPRLSGVELVFLDREDNTPEGLRTAGNENVLATSTSSELHIPATLRTTQKHLSAVRKLIEVIDTNLEGVELALPDRMPAVAPETSLYGVGFVVDTRLDLEAAEKTLGQINSYATST